MSERVAKRIHLLSLVFLIAAASFAYGLAVARYEIWPFTLIKRTTVAAKSLVEHGQLVPEGRRVSAPRDASRETFAIHDPTRIEKGYYAFLGWDEGKQLYTAWLYDDRGERRHAWEIDLGPLDPDERSNDSDTPHAFHVLNDGSIIVGFDGGHAMTRLDACGAPVWVKKGIYHHAMSPSDDGSFWVWRAEGSHYAQYHYLTNFDPETGETLRELGLVEDVIARMGQSSAVFGVRPDHAFVHLVQDPQEHSTVDFFHPNDVDVLRAEHAPMFPMFETGDLLLSFRTLDLVAVLDPDTRLIKWWSRGPWIAQHDPDFTSDGRISVYSNNTYRGRSEIIKIDPKTRAISNDLFHGELDFYSAAMGKHQYLPNGNVLIVVPGQGRILEVTQDGDYVMEFNNVSSGSAQYNEHVENGTWLPSDYFQVVPDCSGGGSSGSAYFE